MRIFTDTTSLKNCCDGLELRSMRITEPEVDDTPVVIGNGHRFDGLINVVIGWVLTHGRPTGPRCLVNESQPQRRSLICHFKDHTKCQSNVY